ncbi:hypothetical protein GYA93_09160 [Gordonia desulfuricans]|uniref:Uncharacterized protein n=1 Tax=Gordonia desulfuricans TaxID=89051 RepID=A0A7K3LNA4_9ACTN|nr:MULTISPECIES: hypothetical protein [Gordonia]NDK89744.1 hypothetical protein [Gordonia desulfuricans]WLP92843.1 hypothetical protein Q9K23_11755 [Gordonia sp. NB41Y]
MNIRRMVMIGAATLGLGVAGLVAAPAAQAFTVAPAPGGGSVTLDRGEAAAVGNANVAGLVDGVLPGYRADDGESIGRGLDRYADWAARTPNSAVRVTVTGVPADPSVGLTALRGR